MPGTDGLRTLAALSILVFHVYMAMHWVPARGDTSSMHSLLDRVIRTSSMRVDMFFVLSSFLLFLPFARALLAGTERPSLRRFGARRFWRIMPLYLPLMTLSALTQLREQATVEQYLLNATLTWPWVDHGVRLMIPSWTLAIEVVFYAVLPLVVVLAARLTRTALTPTQRLVRCAIPLMVAIGVGPAIRGGYITPPAGMDLRLTVLGRFDSFAIGMLCALTVTWLWQRGTLHVPRTWTMIMLGIGSVGAAAVGLRLGYSRIYDGAFASPIEHTFKAVSIALLLIMLARGFQAFGASRLLESRPMRWVGERTYGVFLWHCLVIWALRQLDLYSRSGTGGLVANIVITTLISLALASLTLRTIERPALALSERLRR